MNPDELLPYIDFQKLFEVVRNKTNADMQIIRSQENVEQIQASSAKAKADAARKEQDIAQQEADTRTLAALSAANRNGEQQQAAGAESSQPSANRFAGLSFRR